MAFKMNPKSPILKQTGMFSSPAQKALKGDQHKLPGHLKAKIEAAPGKMYSGNSPFKKGPMGEEPDVDVSAGDKLTAKKAKNTAARAKNNKEKAAEKRKDGKIGRANRLEKRAARKTKRAGKIQERQDDGKTAAGRVISKVKNTVKKAVKGELRDPKKKAARLKKVADGDGSVLGDAGRKVKNFVKEVFVSKKDGEGKWDGSASDNVKKLSSRSPNKKIGVDKKDTKAFEKTKKLEARGERKLEKLEKKKQKVVSRINKKAERKAKRILGDKYGKPSPAKSFKGLVSKLEKQGKSKEAATKIAGAVANAKMKGAGSGPTAKQKARAKK